jgi:phage/plasmid-like protein (TIGR03299 family)
VEEGEVRRFCGYGSSSAEHQGILKKRLNLTKEVYMPHNLSINPQTGQVSMMFHGNTPWHGLGQQLDHPSTSAEAIRAAGLDWEVVKQPLYVKNEGGYLQVENQYMMMRADRINSGPCLGIVSGSYTPLQNLEAFEFFDDIVGQGAAVYHTAGALHHGERVWILAMLPEYIRVIGDDVCNKYLLLSNSHDGKSSVQMKFTPIRVVCQNTLTLALSQGPTIRTAHTRNMHTRMRQARELLGIIHGRFDELAQVFQAMTQVKMDKEKVELYYKMIFPDPRDPSNEIGRLRAAQNRETAEMYYRNGRGNQEKGVIDTLWAAYNGAAEMADYHRWPMNSEPRLMNIWFGDGYLLKARAYSAAVEKLKTWAA